MGSAYVIVGALAVLAMAVDWWSVWTSTIAVERFAKPAVMVALIALALVGDAEPSAARWLLVAGLMFGLAGDIFLLPNVDRFLYGLGCFLVGHLMYSAAFAAMDLAFIGIIGGITAAAALIGYLGWPTVRAVRGGPMGPPVLAYMAVIGLMVVLATATHRWPIAAGGVLFATSDGLLGLDRFVSPAPRRRVLVHILYHLGQAGFVLGLMP